MTVQSQMDQKYLDMRIELSQWFKVVRQKKDTHTAIQLFSHSGEEALFTKYFGAEEQAIEAAYQWFKMQKR